MTFTKITIVLCFFISLNGYCQKKMNVFFKDGSQQLGYVTFTKKHIKFQEKLKGKKKKIEYAQIDSASSYVNPRAKRARAPKVVYVLPTGKAGKQYRVYDKVKDGAVSLYKYSSQGGYSAMWVPTGGGAGGSVYIPSGGGSSPRTVYGLMREGEDFVSVIGESDSSILFVKIHDSFKSQGSDYFQDCPILVEKIRAKEKGFLKKDIKKIVDFYNTQCSNN